MNELQEKSAAELKRLQREHKNEMEQLVEEQEQKDNESRKRFDQQETDFALRLKN